MIRLFYTLSLSLLLHVLTVAAQTPVQQQTGSFSIDDEFPGGNIVLDSISGNRVYIHQDLSDTEASNWFYWNFRVRNAAVETLTFVFTHPWGTDIKALNVIGVRGPAVSTDEGLTWEWLGTAQVKGETFSYQFSPGQKDVRFSFGMPYTSAQLETFLKPFERNPNLDVNTLTLTKAGRKVERLHLGSIYGKARYKIVITARHHACEMMASYTLEGMMKFFLEDQTEGKWFRENVEALIVPFMDKDGVEEGDQGKLRRGRDHNQDYGTTSIYASTGGTSKLCPGVVQRKVRSRT